MTDKIAKFEKIACQGDLMLRRVEELPPGLELTEVSMCEDGPDKGLLILAHSETGHHHAICEPKTAVVMFKTPNPLKSYLQVKVPSVDLKHFRTEHTHKTIQIAKGLYEIRRQREHTPEGFRQVQD